MVSVVEVSKFMTNDKGKRYIIFKLFHKLCGEANPAAGKSEGVRIVTHHREQMIVQGWHIGM